MSLHHERKRGHPTSKLNVRFPEEQREFCESQGRSFSEGAVRMLDIARDAYLVLEPMWREVERCAVEDGVTVGTALAQLAAEGIDARRRAAPVFPPGEPHPFEHWTASSGRSRPDCRRCGRSADAHLEAGLKASLNGQAGVEGRP